MELGGKGNVWGGKIRQYRGHRVSISGSSLRLMLAKSKNFMGKV